MTIGIPFDKELVCEVFWMFFHQTGDLILFCQMHEVYVLGFYRTFENWKCSLLLMSLHFLDRTSGDDWKYEMPEWWNWQTCWTQNPVVATPCGFDPRFRHQTLQLVSPWTIGVCGLFFILALLCSLPRTSANLPFSYLFLEGHHPLSGGIYA